MRQISILLFIVALSVAFGESSDYQSRSRRNAFILRKCMASAELHKRTGSHSVRNPMPTENNQVSQNERLFSSPTESQKSALGANYEMPYNTRRNDGKVDKPVSVHLKNTPLTTVDIKSLRNRSPVFRKKSLLPELERSAASRTIGPLQKIILIKPTN